MRSALQLLGGVAVAGAVAAGSTAFTAAGVISNAGTGFVGGKVAQTVEGATISTIAYTLDATNGTKVHSILLTFADVHTDGKTPTLTFTGGTPVWTTNSTALICTAVENVGHTSTCTANNSVTPVAADGVSGFTTLTVSVV